MHPLESVLADAGIFFFFTNETFTNKIFVDRRKVSGSFEF